jgi:putative ABC transport system permease protein
MTPMFPRILLGSFRRSRRRKLIALGALAVAAAVWTIVLAIAAGLGDRARRDLTEYGANIIVRPEAAESAPSAFGAALPAPPAPETMPEADVAALADIFWRNNILAISPVLGVAARAGGAPVVVEGADFGRTYRSRTGETISADVRSAHPAWKLAAGRWPEAAGQAVAGWRLAAERGWVVGSRLAVEGAGDRRDLVLSGIVRSGEREDGMLLTPLADAQALAGRPGRVGRIDVAALTTPELRVFEETGLDPKSLPPAEYDRWYCTPYASSIAHQISEAIPGSRAAPVWRVTAAEQRSAHIVRVLLLFGGGAALVAAFFAVFATLYDAVTERAPEIGLWKALGAEPEKVAAVFLAEAAITGLIGGTIGAAVGLAAAPSASRVIFGTPVAAAPVLGLVTAGTAVAVSLAASLRPVRRALALEPVAALRQG